MDHPPVNTLEWQGHEIQIEVPGGGQRSNGTVIPEEMKGYGYFDGLQSSDGDSLDAILGPKASKSFKGNVYVATQIDPESGEVIQPKVFIGFTAMEDAKAAFRLLWPEDMYGGMWAVPTKNFTKTVLPRLAEEKVVTKVAAEKPLILQHVPRMDRPEEAPRAHESIILRGWDPKLHGKTTKIFGGHEYLKGPKGVSFTPVNNESEVRPGSPVFAVGSFKNPLTVDVDGKKALPERYGKTRARLTRALQKEGYDALFVTLGGDLLEVVAFDPNSMPRFSSYQEALSHATGATKVTTQKTWSGWGLYFVHPTGETLLAIDTNKRRLLKKAGTHDPYTGVRNALSYRMTRLEGVPLELYKDFKYGATKYQRSGPEVPEMQGLELATADFAPYRRDDRAFCIPAATTTKVAAEDPFDAKGWAVDTAENLIASAAEAYLDEARAQGYDSGRWFIQANPTAFKTVLEGNWRDYERELPEGIDSQAMFDLVLETALNILGQPNSKQSSTRVAATAVQTIPAEWDADLQKLLSLPKGATKVVMAEAFHGTMGGFEMFDQNASGLGTHFGTRESAEQRLRSPDYGLKEDDIEREVDDLLDWETYETLSPEEQEEERNRARQMIYDGWDNNAGYNDVDPVEEGGAEIWKFDLDVKNPLRCTDILKWHEVEPVAAELRFRGVISLKGEQRVLKMQPQKAWATLRKAIEKKGYDSIVYRNAVEDIGEDSYIVWDNSKIKRLATKVAAMDLIAGPNRIPQLKKQYPQLSQQILTRHAMPQEKTAASLPYETADRKGVFSLTDVQIGDRVRFIRDVKTRGGKVQADSLGTIEEIEMGGPYLTVHTDIVKQRGSTTQVLQGEVRVDVGEVVLLLAPEDSRL